MDDVDQLIVGLGRCHVPKQVLVRIDLLQDVGFSVRITNLQEIINIFFSQNQLGPQSLGDVLPVSVGVDSRLSTLQPQLTVLSAPNRIMN